MINDDTPLYGTRYRLKLMVGVFKCRTCGHEQSIEQTGELMVAPTSCPNGCDCTKKGFILDPDKSTFEETPYTVKTSLRELKEKVKDWDRERTDEELEKDGVLFIPKEGCNENEFVTKSHRQF